MKQNIANSTNSILNTSSLIGLPKWRAAGFEELEKLCQSVSDALCQTDEMEQYHQLAWLRSWLFWTDLRKVDNAMEQILLTAHFYGVVLAVLPLFPPRYLEPLVEICMEKIERAQNVSEADGSEFGLGRLLKLAHSYLK